MLTKKPISSSDLPDAPGAADRPAAAGRSAAPGASGRSEELIGFFVNILLFRQPFRQGESFLAVLERVRATTLAVHAHQNLPFELLVDTLGVERSLAHNPLFQVMLL